MDCSEYYIHLAAHSDGDGGLYQDLFRKWRPSRDSNLFTSQGRWKLLMQLMTFIQNVCFVALYTGMRLGELLNLQWCDVDLVSRVIHVRNSETFTTKTRKNRSIPMNDQLHALLCEMKDRRVQSWYYVLGEISFSRQRIEKISGLHS